MRKGAGTRSAVCAAGSAADEGFPSFPAYAALQLPGHQAVQRFWLFLPGYAGDRWARERIGLVDTGAEMHDAGGGLPWAVGDGLRRIQRTVFVQKAVGHVF